MIRLPSFIEYQFQVPGAGRIVWLSHATSVLNVASVCVGVDAQADPELFSAREFRVVGQGHL